MICFMMKDSDWLGQKTAWKHAVQIQSLSSELHDMELMESSFVSTIFEYYGGLQFLEYEPKAYTKASYRQNRRSAVYSTRPCCFQETSSYFAIMAS